MPPLVYVVRRGVKEAMEAKADALVLDMKTDGGRVDVTEEIIQMVSKFPGLTVTYVNDRAFSAGAFIAVGTQKIYMAPQSVIGAAAPILMVPGGGCRGQTPRHDGGQDDLGHPCPAARAGGEERAHHRGRGSDD